MGCCGSKEAEKQAPKEQPKPAPKPSAKPETKPAEAKEPPKQEPPKEQPKAQELPKRTIYNAYQPITYRPRGKITPEIVAAFLAGLQRDMDDKNKRNEHFSKHCAMNPTDEERTRLKLDQPEIGPNDKPTTLPLYNALQLCLRTWDFHSVLKNPELVVDVFARRAAMKNSEPIPLTVLTKSSFFSLLSYVHRFIDNALTASTSKMAILSHGNNNGEATGEAFTQKTHVISDKDILIKEEGRAVFKEIAKDDDKVTFETMFDFIIEKRLDKESEDLKANGGKRSPRGSFGGGSVSVRGPRAGSTRIQHEYLATNSPRRRSSSSTSPRPTAREY